MSPSERLKPVRRVAEDRERAAARGLGDAQRDLKDQQTKLEQLLLFQQEYQQRFDAAARGGMGAQQLRDYQGFMAQLQQAIERQRDVVRASLRERTLKHSQWQQRHTRTEAIGKAMERYQRAELQAEERIEQKVSDEYGLRGARRKGD